MPPLAHPDAVTETVAAGGRRFTLLRPRSAEALIDEDEYARDERLPYWAELWPSGRALADALALQDLAGRRVVELGCGLGLPSLAAAVAGARVLATDWYPEALAYLRHNARAAGAPVETLLVDWREPPARLLAGAPYDLVAAADVLYEARNASALERLLPRLAGPAGRVLIADPRRPDAHLLFDPLVAAGWSHRREDVTVRGRVDEAGPVVHLHHLRPPDAGA
jgi:predicted nicotinamide N-methyase